MNLGIGLVPTQFYLYHVTSKETTELAIVQRQKIRFI